MVPCSKKTTSSSRRPKNACAAKNSLEKKGGEEMDDGHERIGYDGRATISLRAASMSSGSSSSERPS